MTFEEKSAECLEQIQKSPRPAEQAKECFGIVAIMDALGAKSLTIVDVSPAASSLRRAAEDPEKTDYLVRVQWIKTVDPKNAIREKGFFGNQNSVARPRSPKWDYTVERLKTRFGVQ